MMQINQLGVRLLLPWPVFSDDIVRSWASTASPRQTAMTSPACFRNSPGVYCARIVLSRRMRLID